MKKSILIFCIFSLRISGTFAQTCQGPSLLNADFNDGSIHTDWTILNLDGNELYFNMPVKGYTGEWQAYNHYGQNCVTSASRYDNFGASNDYLITPAVVLGSAPLCLSWKSARAYNTPSFENEQYDVLISTTSPTVSGLQAHPSLVSVVEIEESWITHSVDLSAYAGQTVYIGFWQYTPGGYALCLDDIKIASPVNLDAAVISLNGSDVFAPNALIPVSCEIVNGGTTAIDALSLNWNVNGGSVHTTALSGLSLASQDHYDFSDTDPWIPTANGTYYLKAWTSNVNGSTDQYLMNDTITKVIYINDFPRKVLMEEFTNASCPPCADQNPVYDALIHTNLADGNVTAIKYHVAWPGYDPMNELNDAEPEDRVAYYGVFGVPFAVNDGAIKPFDDICYTGAPFCVDQEYLDEFIKVPSLFGIAIETKNDAGNYVITSKITAKTDIPENSFTVQVVLMEDTILYDYPPGTNGEMEFYQVQRKMLPTSDGTPLGALSNGQELVLNYSTPILPDYKEDQLRALVFIQNENGKKIYQSEITNSNYQTGISEVDDNTVDFTMYPNPASGIVNFSLNNSISGATLTIFNALGQKIAMYEWNDASKHFYFDSSSLPSGLYWIRMNSKAGSSMQKLIKQ